MKTTYYFGIVEFGTFAPSDITANSTPLAIIQRVDVVKEFDVPEDAWQFYCEGGFDSYVSVDAKDQNGVQYELVFKRHA
jgi:hypothetical protein